MIRYAVALLPLLAAPAMAASGTVNFSFTGFSGAFATTGSDKDPANPANYTTYGAVNGMAPTYTGSVIDGLSQTVIGAAPLSGDTAVFAYTSQPNPIANVVSFTARDFTDIAQGQDFVLGTISFTNGYWVGGSFQPNANVPVYLDFRITTTSDIAEFNQSITGQIKVVTNMFVPNVCNGSTPLSAQQNEADFLTVQSSANIGAMGSLRVFDQLCKPANETNVGTIDLIAQFNSLDLVGLANPGESGFYVASTDIGPIQSDVPEPATWATMIAGMGLLGTTLRRSRTSARRQPA